jgi:hypothetical protein
LLGNQESLNLVLLITVGFIEVAILVWRGNAKLSNIIAVGLLSALLGAIVANLTDVTDILVSLGGANALHLQRAVEHVDTQLTEVQKISEQIKELAKQIETDERLITGGDSFCYIPGLPIPGYGTMIFKSGKDPLYTVEMKVVERPKSFDDAIIVQLGDFPIDNGVKEIRALPMRAEGDRAAFDIYFDARNGFWTETLLLRLINGKWRQAVRVFKGEKELYKSIDKDFPTERDGSVKWLP